MNKYQYAKLTLAGRKLARSLLEYEDEDDYRYFLNSPNNDNDELVDIDDPSLADLFSSDMSSDDSLSYSPKKRNRKSVELDPKATIESRKKYYKALTPDSVINDKYGNAANFTSFIYSVATKKVFCDAGHMFHQDAMYDDESALSKIQSEPRNTNIILGRFGFTRKGGGFITIWSLDNKYRGIQSKASLPNVISMLKALLPGGGAKVIGESPAGNNITKDYIFTQPGVSEPFTVEEVLEPGFNPAIAKCDLKINVGGMPVPFSKFVADLHMVKGQQLDSMKVALCASEKNLVSQFKSKKCLSQIGILRDIKSRIGSCGDLYGSAKKVGQAAVQQDYGNVFRQGANIANSGNFSSDPVGQNFRTQRDIDKAWDYSRKESFDFYNWLKEN